MKTGLDFKSVQFDQVRVQSELEDLKWHLIRINHNLINFINVQYFIGYPVLSCEQNKAIWLAIYSWIINEFEI
jgi:glutaredoxin-related protein